MAHPPRIPVRLPWGTSVVYFLTICERDRKKAWANAYFFRVFQSAADELATRELWFITAAIIMPDHFHLLAAPLQSRERPIGTLSGALKRWIKQEFCDPKWDWQSGSFDRLLRANEQAKKKWEYMRENPVRAGLVSDWQDWPWSIGIREE